MERGSELLCGIRMRNIPSIMQRMSNLDLFIPFCISNSVTAVTMQEIAISAPCVFFFRPPFSYHPNAKT